jgi:hypothetical protein
MTFLGDAFRRIPLDSCDDREKDFNLVRNWVYNSDELFINQGKSVY